LTTSNAAVDGADHCHCYGTPIQAQIADSVADADMVCRANAGVIL
jgi:hypothetical protein